MGSPWLATGPYSVRMTRTASRKLFKHLPGHPGPMSAPKVKKQIFNRCLSLFATRKQCLCSRSAVPAQQNAVPVSKYGAYAVEMQCLCSKYNACAAEMQCLWSKCSACAAERNACAGDVGRIGVGARLIQKGTAPKAPSARPPQAPVPGGSQVPVES